ncbi:MAG TPA: hypothetical protein VME40_17750 [Caulobacteraceae bacterium]|nr:hypothetical protein [Caulobacteraceae bacterium]
MAQPRPNAVRPEASPVRAGRATRPQYLNEANGDEIGAASPALELQSQLGDAFTEQSTPDDGRRWSPRATILLGGGGALTLWLAILAGAWAIFRGF